MFTGIIEELGEVAELRHGADSAVMTIRGPLVTSDATLGSSIAVDGVCLTVTAVDGDLFSVDVMAETLARSGLGRLAPGARVNLERALPAGGRMSGHIVQGHVDGTGRILQRRPGDRWEVVRISAPQNLQRYIVEKGSIAVDGTSLTVSATGPGWFEIGLIPTTLATTVLGTLPVGEEVNLEADVIAKYVESLLAGREAPDPSQSNRPDVTRTASAATTTTTQPTTTQPTTSQPTTTQGELR
ncbi:Riboflavin synthase alpha chain [Acidipropionibacterium jensenii]|uniref:Riboflavin synthase n=2 Tax=Acidipropionibacterium jensenii TaxID=1749 RepID=A0A3S5EVD0_9ACTN|nr:riboflavin synthase subunit alpha [Acidipropionibacterium jensenii]QCV88386.1 riboflavin synthase [Acidipropionibacterium jensenii]VEI04190.1 Riboflavin synthase alpha chain [Acidipropionibacterium jensenii]